MFIVKRTCLGITTSIGGYAHLLTSASKFDLDPPIWRHSDTKAKVGLAIREEGNGQIAVAGAKHEPVEGREDALGLLQRGSLVRSPLVLALPVVLPPYAYYNLRDARTDI